MAKQGMKRPEIHHGPENEAFVPGIQGKAKSGKKRANPIIVETMGAEQKVWHEKPMPKVYRALDTDLARDNLENDLTDADLQDLQ